MTSEKPKTSNALGTERPRIPRFTVGIEGQESDPVPSTEDLHALFGTRAPETARQLYLGAIMALGEEGNMFSPLIAAIAVEEKPQSTVEAMMLLNMVVTQVLINRTSMRVNCAGGHLERDSKLLMKALSTFDRQTETLRRYRTGGAQTVRVEHVHVNEGGQAIIGQVNKGGGGS